MRPLRSRASQPTNTAKSTPNPTGSLSKSKKGIRERKEEKWSAGAGGRGQALFLRKPQRQSGGERESEK